MTLTFVVRNQTLLYIDTKVIPRIGSAKYLELKFKFITKDWTNLRKTLHISAGEYSEPFILESDTFQVPTYYTQQSAFSITLLGDSDDGVVVPTNEVSVALDESNTLWTAVPPDPQNSAYLELLKSVVPSDWNQNDPTAKDYIKNRTHWVDDDGTVHKLDEKFLPDSSAVSFAAQSLTDSQKAQARENIDAQEKICEEMILDTSTGFGYVGLINAAGYYPKTIYKARIGGDYYENVPCNNYGDLHPEYTLGEHTITLNYNAGSMDVSPNDISGSDIEFYKQESVQVILPKHIPNAPLIVTITKDANDSYSADKTNAEIYAAYEKGAYIRVECSWAPYVGSLFAVGPDHVVFMFDLKAVPYFGSFSGFVAVVIHPNGVEVTTVDNPLILPPAGTEAGSVWTIDENDGPTWKELPTALPAVTTADNGKILKVVDGAWAVVDA